MIKFTALLEKFGKKGEKTGWTYFVIRSEYTNKINPGVKTSFRVKGKLDNLPIKSVAILPMGEGDFIMPVNGAMRKGLKKQNGEKIIVQLELDKAPLKLNSDFLACLADDKKAKQFFEKLPKSHQNYYSKWIESAKTDETKAKRIAQAMNGFRMGMNYPEMIRYYKANKL
jgi:hypothetical protein